MFIEFGKIRYKNFLSSGNTFLEFDFKKTKSTLIVGTNGVGKCLEKNTTIEVDFKTNEVEEKFKKFLKNRK